MSPMERHPNLAKLQTICMTKLPLGVSEKMFFFVCDLGELLLQDLMQIQFQFS